MALLRYDVFISYSRQDTATVLPLVEELRQRGYKVFFDARSIVVGEPWKQRLAHAIRASRVCILCWSQHTRDSEYVTFEYSRAEGLGRPVLPWLLDHTPLPKMVEIQGVSGNDPVRAAEVFAARIGRRLFTLRLIQGASLLCILLVAGFIGWRTHRPPPPVAFGGRVTDSVTNLPVAGVNVEVDAGNLHLNATTGADGRYTVNLPQPEPQDLRIVFSKPGYRGESPVAVPPTHDFNTDIVPLEQTH